MKKLCAFLFLWISVSGIAQEARIVTGRVFDGLNEHYIQDVSVVRSSTGERVRTNAKGYFQIKVSEGDELVLNHVRYDSINIIVPESLQFKVIMNVKRDFLRIENGIADFYKKIGRNIKYPSSARSKPGLVVVVTFDIGEKGLIENLQIPEKSYKSITREIQNVFSKHLFRWNIEYAKRTFELPFVFKKSDEDELKIFSNNEVEVDYYLDEVVITAYKISRRLH